MTIITTAGLTDPGAQQLAALARFFVDRAR
jgi:hypothetical protein